MSTSMPSFATRVRRRVACAAAWHLLCAPALALDAGDLRAWPDDFSSRVSVLALLQTLNADLLSHDSATFTLERWCAAHRQADPAHVTAELVRGADKAPTPELLQVLGVSAPEAVRYRRVRLHCGGHVLSEADNWYVPARLTPEMNHVLETTDTAFGRAVQALHFQRRTLAARLLWSPLPEGWEMADTRPGHRAGTLAIPPEVIEHRAVLSLPDGTPFSVVVETYSSEVLAFPRSK
jgi:chorismate-pyruvate lyase